MTAGETAERGTMTKEILLLDLRQFDGGDGSDAAEAGTSAENASAGAGEGSQDAAETSKEEQTTPEELEKEFDELIHGKFREQYRQRQQKAIRNRLKSVEAERGENAKNAELKDAISMRYGLNPDASVDDIMAAIKSDKAFLEEAAAREGLSPEQYQKMAALRQQAHVAQRAADQARYEQMQAEARQRLETETAECREYFPDFDFEMEYSENEKFKHQLEMGVSVLEAYKFAHMDEIMANGMHQAAAKGAKVTADAVKNNLRRPNEAGTGSHAAASVDIDYGKLSDEEFHALRDRVLAGG